MPGAAGMMPGFSSNSDTAGVSLEGNGRCLLSTAHSAGKEPTGATLDGSGRVGLTEHLQGGSLVEDQGVVGNAQEVFQFFDRNCDFACHKNEFGTLSDMP
mmetsp:Transcript_12379/g.29237  ORF Transcript_12379/g.29237 Transcript_12379/m.29237 type:complete len:100 (+) Transcript_12379:161-460(+)